MPSGRCPSRRGIRQDRYPLLLQQRRYFPLPLPNYRSLRDLAVIGTVEELAACPRTLTLIREQFETNFFSPVNIIKAALPAMREKRAGHIIVLTGISRSCSFAPWYGLLGADSFVPASHLGTPGLGIYCASGWALEGFCDVRPKFPFIIHAILQRSAPVLSWRCFSDHPMPTYRASPTRSPPSTSK